MNEENFRRFTLELSNWAPNLVPILIGMLLLTGLGLVIYDLFKTGKKGFGWAAILMLVGITRLHAACRDFSVSRNGRQCEWLERFGLGWLSVFTNTQCFLLVAGRAKCLAEALSREGQRAHLRGSRLRERTLLHRTREGQPLPL